MTEGEGEHGPRFGALYQAYRADVVAYCTWRADSASDAQDAVADVFLTAWRRLDEVPAGDAGRVWLYATARRTLANQRRSTRRRTALAERLAFAAPAQQQPDDAAESLVRDALGRLGPLDREVLLLAEWEGLSPAQIASVLRCPQVTARGRLHRARRRFRSAFEKLATAERGERGSRPAADIRTTSVSHAIGEGS